MIITIFLFIYRLLPLKYFLIALIGTTGMASIFYDIRIGLMAGVFLLPFLPDMLGILFMIFLMGVYIFRQVGGRNIEFTTDKVDMMIVVYFIIMVISTITSKNVSGSLRDLGIHISGLSLVFVMMNNLRTKEDINKFVVALSITASLVALYGLYQYVVGVEMDAAWLDAENNPGISTRVYSVFYNPNILAEYLVMMIPLSVSLFWYNKNLLRKSMFFGMFGIMSLALVLTLSRGGWLGFAFSAFVFILLVEKRLLLSIFPIALIGIYTLPETILNRILSIGNLGDSSNAYRITMWQITRDIIRDNWMAGVGFGHIPFKETFETYIRTMPTFHAHNTYLQTASEIGIPGLLVFLGFLFILFKYGVIHLVNSNDKYIKILGAGAIAGLAGVLLHGAVENILYLSRIIISFWILVGIILTLIRIEKGENKIS